MSVILQCTGLARHFGGVFAVNGVDLAVREGTIHSVIGPNGAGKSTFFNLISGEILPSSGTVTFDGTDITGTPPHRMPHLGISRCFQRTNVFPDLTIHDNVWAALFARMNKGPADYLKRRNAFPDIEEKTAQIIREVGLAHKTTALARTLSHGQSRMLEVAVSLAGLPRLLLLDEPTQGLAPEATVEMTHLIRSLAGRYTILLIEHKMNIVMEISDTVSVLSLGRMIEEGPPAQIRTSQRVQDAYLGRDTA
ncbi:ABC transporter ATP-binding protein [Acuticoccus sediminis]|uniref:ABC transporter ATP-binding protein n=1 Tax=Acuticoccus sediminis TaxID=2184697 RepID=A0A8B2P197_9HYPH|nr:ABC transporter ATP-binding protein [Acuticoccus sediminis]RAI02560.1 ABC transporter ATP-binding protein [Acuticoccus sediminis]